MTEAMPREEGQDDARLSKFSVIPARAVVDPDVTATMYRVLGVLAAYADKSGWCWPSQATLGRSMGVSRQAIGKQIAKLEELGYVESKRRWDPDRGETTKLYRVVNDFKEDASEDTNEGTGAQPGVAPPATSEVAPPATPEVAPPATSRGCTNTPLNTPREQQEGGMQPEVDVAEVQVGRRLYDLHEELTQRFAPSRLVEETIRGWVEAEVTHAEIDRAYESIRSWSPSKPWAAFASRLGDIIAARRLAASRPAPAKIPTPSAAELLEYRARMAAS